MDGGYYIEPKFTDAWSFIEDYAAVSDGTLYGFINASGVIVIDYQFIGEPVGFSKGLARVKGSNFWGYIDKSGVYVWQSD